MQQVELALMLLHAALSMHVRPYVHAYHGMRHACLLLHAASSYLTFNCMTEEEHHHVHVMLTWKWVHVKECYGNSRICFSSASLMIGKYHITASKEHRRAAGW